MSKIKSLFNFLTFGTFLSVIILFVADLLGFSLNINFNIFSRILVALLVLALLINIREIKNLFFGLKDFKKFILLSLINLLLISLFLMFYPIFRFGSPLVWEDRIANFKADKEIELSLNKKIKQSFQAESNNLGTIGLRIISRDLTEDEVTSEEKAKTGQELSEEEESEELSEEASFNKTDKIVFRIKEDKKEIKDYFYENTYELNQYWQTNYFLFGFPTQEDSEDKNYVFEIEKTKEGETNRVFLIEENSQGKFNFYPRYVYNFASLKTDWEPILLNISLKTNQFLEEKNNQINFIFAFLLIELLIFIFLRKEEEQFKERLNFYLKYGFLSGLLLVTISSLNFEFIKNINYLQIIIDNLSKYNLFLTLLTIVIGFLLFYFNKEKIAQRIIEENKEKQKKGWIHTIFFFIVIIFFATRLYQNNFINASDNFNVSAIKNMYENGVSFYKYSKITDFLMLNTVKIFGFNFFTVKIPFIFYSFITLIFLYLTVKLIDKKLSLIASFLFAISPWAIILSRITRDYSFDLMIGGMVLCFSFILLKKIKYGDSLKRNIKYILLYFLLALLILVLCKYNRSQTAVVGIFFLIPFIFSGYFIFEQLFSIKYKNFIYWSIVSSVLLLGAFLLNKFPFGFAFHKPDLLFFDIYFNPQINSPWHWFHSLNIQPILLLSFFILGVFTFDKRRLNKIYFINLLTIFTFVMFLFTTKYQSHLNYVPTRYIYFLIIIYIILLSNGIMTLFKLYKNKIAKIVLLVIFILMINPKSLIYAINPSLAYEKEGISTLRIDNIGIGHFALLETVNFLKKDLGVNDDTALIFDGRYEEFLLFLNRPMDTNRFLLRKSNLTYFDISKNTYVQSNYFDFTELNKAISNHKEGYYITSEKETYSGEGELIELYEGSLIIDNINLNFIKKINDFKIYSWKIY